jgi:hypothetical protein
MKHYCYTLIDYILIISLSVAVVCSFVISIEVFYYKNDEYRKTFSSWQLPMLFALLADIYIMCK